MNEILELLVTFAHVGWVWLCVVFAVALGFLLFDCRPRKAIDESAAESRRRRAA